MTLKINMLIPEIKSRKTMQNHQLIFEYNYKIFKNSFLE